MGLIMKNNIQYPGNVIGGSGGSGATTAAQLTYDNTTSKLEATNVQSAIDEVNNKVGTGGSSNYNVAWYDTSERVIGRWINGKPIYQKVGRELPTNVDEYIKKGEYKNIIHPIANDTSDEYELIANNTSNADYKWHAFDGDKFIENRCWYWNGLPAWLGVHLLKGPKVVTKVSITQENYTPEFFKTCAIQGSNDGETWTDISTFVATTFRNGQQYEHEFENDIAYSYYRVYFADRNTNGAGVSVQELTFYEMEENAVWQYTKTTDEENSFSPSQIEGIEINAAQGIDVDNLITTLAAAAEQTYTAAEDCYVISHLIGMNNLNSSVFINDVVIGCCHSDPDTISILYPIFLKKGQTIKIKREVSSDFYREAYVYGVLNNNTSEKYHKYTTEERVVGEWIDGKPLYEKVLYYEGNIKDQDSFKLEHGINGLNLVIYSSIMVKRKDSFHWEALNISDGSEKARYNIDETGISIVSTWDPTQYLICILRYTKSTD